MKQKKKPSYFIVGLRNGRVVISVHGKRKEDVVSSTSVNDGYWHKVNQFLQFWNQKLN
jgi:Laminin G domain